MAIKNQKIVADFETTTDTNDVRVWAVGAVDIDTLETVYISNSLDDFMEWLSTRNTVCYYHNAKFDIEFILPWLFKNGFQYSDKPADRTFHTLITDTGLVYSLTIYFQKLNKKYKKVTIYDSYKKLPFKVSVISKAFELKDEKLKIDYDAPRPVGHELTELERAYLVNDCRIVAAALQIQFAQGLKKMTNASDAMNGYKTIMGKEQFERMFPVLPVPLDADIRRAYKGGYVYLNPKHRGRRGLKGKTLDVNSHYPWAMYYNVLPYGYPMFFEGEPTTDDLFPLYITHFSCRFRLKPDHLPTVQLKNNPRYIETEYLTTSEAGDGTDEPVEMYMTSVDHALFLGQYDIVGDIEYINGWKFRGRQGLFCEYIDHWMHVKETSTGALRQLAKLMLNSLYGRFATNPRSYVKIPRMDADGVVRYDVYNEKYAKEHDLPPPELRDPVYTAMGAFITAYARDKTIRSAQAVYDRFIYADTDSLHLIGEEIPAGLEVHPTRLGAWKDEGTFTDSKYLRAKTYMETMHECKKDSLEEYCHLMQQPSTAWIRREADGIHAGITKVTCAGMPDNVKEKVTYENFCPGATFSGKLMPRRFPGGIVLVDTTFTIK